MKTRTIAALAVFSGLAALSAAADETYYLENLDFSWMSSGWEHPVANKSISMRKLTIDGSVDLANVVFGVTNPEDLPAVVLDTAADWSLHFPVFAATSISGAVATENGGYAPAGSISQGMWIARESRDAANTVEFLPYVRSGFCIIIN